MILCSIRVYEFIFAYARMLFSIMTTFILFTRMSYNVIPYANANYHNEYSYARYEYMNG